MFLEHFGLNGHYGRIPKQILIVEDDLVLQTWVERILKAVFGDVWLEWSTSAEEAQRKLSERAFDLILADYSLNGKMTGLDLWERCIELYPNTPFIVASGMTVPEFLGLVGRSRVCPPFLPKPFYPGEFKQMVETCVRREAL